MRISKTRSNKVIKASGAVTTTSQSAAFPVGTGDDLIVMIDATASSGTPSVVVSVQWSHNATDWFTSDPADVMTAITGASKVCKLFTVKGLYARLNYAVSGGTPSLTFSAHAIIGD